MLGDERLLRRALHGQGGRTARCATGAAGGATVGQAEVGDVVDDAVDRHTVDGLQCDGGGHARPPSIASIRARPRATMRGTPHSNS